MDKPMSNEIDTVLFEAKDPFGRTITLSSNRYYGHIISSDMNHQAHPEFTPDEIKKTIESPEVIYKSSFLDSDVYFGKTSALHPKLYLKVPVAIYDNDKTGEVQTAFLSKHISGNIDERGLKYVKSRL